MGDEKSLKDFHHINMIIWMAILASITILSSVTLIIDSTIALQPIAKAAEINQIIFLLAVALAFAILFFKRSLFMPAKILSKLGDKPVAERTSQCLNQLRKNYIIVWAMGEAICILGFTNYILTVNIRYFLVFAVVSLYSVLINMPRVALLKNCGDMNLINM